LNYAYYNNRFYRRRFYEAGIKPEHIKYPEDLKKIPVLTKEEIRKNMPHIISSRFNRHELLRFKTGGSTGKPLEIYITEECSELRNACARRHYRWTGWKPGEPIGAVWGNPPLLNSLKKKLKWYLLNPVIYLDTMNVDEKAVLEFAKEWKRVKPTLLFGHSHSIYLLAQYVQELGVTEIRPKGIIGTSMMLLANERKFIERVFGVKVFNRYGCEEVSLIASECERHEGTHLNIEHLFIEFIKDDGFSAEPGEQGKIIVTDLFNKAMPFIRYQVEDIGIPSDRQCTCGRGLPLLEKVIGRTADFLIKRDGSKVAGISLIENTLTKYPGIKQMQIVQDAIDKFTINIVPDRKYLPEIERELVAYFRKTFGADVYILLLTKKKIEPEKSGKYRFSICRIKG